MEGSNNVIPIKPEGSEYINGTIRRLGSLSIGELHSLADDAEARMVDAAVDVQIVRDYIDRFHSDTGGDAA